MCSKDSLVCAYIDSSGLQESLLKNKNYFFDYIMCDVDV